MNEINENSKMAYCISGDAFITVGFWLSAENVKSLAEEIQSEFLYGSLASEFDLEDSYESLDEIKKAMEDADDKEEKLACFEKIRSLLEKTEAADDIHRLNRIYLDLVQELESLKGTDIMITCFDDPYDAVGLLDSHGGYNGIHTMDSLQVDFESDVSC